MMVKRVVSALLRVVRSSTPTPRIRGITPAERMARIRIVLCCAGTSTDDPCMDGGSPSRVVSQ